MAFLLLKNYQKGLINDCSFLSVDQSLQLWFQSNKAEKMDSSWDKLANKAVMKPINSNNVCVCRVYRLRSGPQCHRPAVEIQRQRWRPTFLHQNLPGQDTAGKLVQLQSLWYRQETFKYLNTFFSSCLFYKTSFLRYF